MPTELCRCTNPSVPEERSAEKKNRKNKETKSETKEEKRAEKDEKILPEEKNTTSVALPCIDKLRDEFVLRFVMNQVLQLVDTGTSYYTTNTTELSLCGEFGTDLLSFRAAASANFLTKETPSPRDSNQKVTSRNRDTAFQARLQREDISRLLVSEERRRRGVRLDQDSDVAFVLRLQRQEFASAFGGTVAETIFTSSSSTALAFLLLLPKQI
ncbi:hypothetical protein YC2023_119667 [Brassica napus]